MNDRVSTHPGRVKLTPVSGYIYDLEYADEPTVIGTPLNKANLLADATASAIEERFNTLPATPNEALALLARCAVIETQSYVGTGTSGSNHPNTLTFSHEPKFVLIAGEDNLGGYNSAALVWSHMGASGTFRLWDEGQSGAGYNYNHYTRSNSRKTITWYADSNAAAMAQVQLNMSGYTYTVISFY